MDRILMIMFIISIGFNVLLGIEWDNATKEVISLNDRITELEVEVEVEKDANLNLEPIQKENEFLNEVMAQLYIDYCSHHGGVHKIRFDFNELVDAPEELNHTTVFGCASNPLSGIIFFDATNKKFVFYLGEVRP